MTRFITKHLILIAIFATLICHLPRANAQYLQGGDPSILTKLESDGIKFKDTNGTTTPCLTIFKNHAWNAIRLRLWVNPSGKDSLVNNLNYTTALAKRVKAAGFYLWLDIQYSDTWADPGTQTKPAAWKNMKGSALQSQVTSYTSNVIQTLAANGAMPDFVQVGNEIDAGMLWPDGKIATAGWPPFVSLVIAGINGVKQGAAAAGRPTPKIAIHRSFGQDWGGIQWFYDNFNNEMAKQGGSYDIIALSYYTSYGSTVLDSSLSDVTTAMTNCATRYGKPVVIAETSYWYAGTSPSGTAYPYTPSGQAAYVSALVSANKNLPNGLGGGVFYWEPEWVPDPNLSSNQGWQCLFDNSNNQALAGVNSL